MFYELANLERFNIKVFTLNEFSKKQYLINIAIELILKNKMILTRLS